MDIAPDPAHEALAAYRFDVLLQEFTVSYDYPVHFTRRVFDGSNPLLAETLDRRDEGRRHRAVIYVDSNVASAHPALCDEAETYFAARPSRLALAAAPQIVPGGAGAKSELDIVREIMTVIGDLHMDRQSFVIGVGGGAVLDMVGFAASLVHRGLRLVRVPSTTLAQGDAGIGVKNGMDIHGQKNFVGTFAPPFAVLNDFALLPTLTDRDWIGGVAEAFKVAIIKDARFFDVLCACAERLRARDQAVMEAVVSRCAAIHLEHIRTGGDPFEFGSVRPLDFGHWAGHQLENMSGYTLGHGQAVAIGVALDAYYAMRIGLIPESDFARIAGALCACGLPVWHALLERRAADGSLEVLRGMELLREHLGGSLHVTLPDGIGKRIEVCQVRAELIEAGVAFLAGIARP